MRIIMRLLVINPNINEDVTALIGAEARRSCSRDTELVLRTAPYGTNTSRPASRG